MKRRGRLVLRLYAIGMAQLALVVAATVAIAIAMTKLRPFGDLRGLRTQIEPIAHDRARLAHALEQIGKREGWRLTVYDDTRAVAASNVKPPLPLPLWSEKLSGPDGPHFIVHGRHTRDEDGERPRFVMRGPDERIEGDEPPPMPRPPPGFGFGGRPPGPPPEVIAPLTVKGRNWLAVARFDHPHPPFGPAWFILIAGLVIVGVGAWLTARWLARPVERLARAAQALGEGDLRARVRLQRSDELGELGGAFDEMAGRIETLLRTERELLANVSHELRTPLARIRVALEIAAEGDAETARSSLSEIAHDLAELETIVEDVLSATRLSLLEDKAPASGFALRLEQVEPARVVEHARERFMVRRPGRALEVSVDEGLPRVKADPALLRRVLDNLLENAHKYSPDQEAAISVRAALFEGRVMFEVVDRGVGISAEDQPRIFDPFFRGERSRSRAAGGVGLGLTLAKRIVDAHEGMIEVHSAAGAGTTVRVLMPASPDAISA